MAAGSSDGPGGAGRPRPKLALVALGCRVNRADVDSIAADLVDRFDVARDRERADVVVVNTCCITTDAESAARRAIRQAAREHPGAPIVAAGCYAELAAETLAGLPGVVAVVGAKAQGSVAGLVARLAGGAPAPDAGHGAGWGDRAAAPARHTRPFLKIQDGCDQRCSFCVVPTVRGASRSLPAEEALRRIEELGRTHPEVVLTGVHLGAYGRDLSPATGLAALVREAVRRRLARRLRLSSIEPNELPLELLLDADTAAAVCEHFHLPLQSGSPRILEAMRRPYGVDGFRRVIREAAALAPGACLGTDLLVGFPGETDEDHRATLALVESLPLAYLHVFPFSPRPGTPAAALPGAVPGAVVRERVHALLALSERKWQGYLAAQTGRVQEVVVERLEGGIARGTARRYVTVRWPATRERRGDLVRVNVASHDGSECFGVRAETFESRLPP